MCKTFVIANFAEITYMQKSILYLLAGTAISFIFNHFVMETKGWQAELYSSFAFGLGWAMVYFVDRREWPLMKKLGFSFVGMFIITLLGLLLFNVELMVPALMRFSLIFVAYYLFASFRSSKTLRK